MLPLVTAARDEWMHGFVKKLVQRYPQIEEAYLLGDRARGTLGQLPDFNLLLYAGYDNALDLLMAMARAQHELCPIDADAIVHVYVENYGGTLTGIWGGSLIQNTELRQWHEGSDYIIVYSGTETEKIGLPGRIADPYERRQQERRLQERRRDGRETPGRRQTDRRQGFYPDALLI